MEQAGRASPLQPPQAERTLATAEWTWKRWVAARLSARPKGRTVGILHAAAARIFGVVSPMASRIKTFSIGFSEASYDESRYARLIASRYATDHHERILSADACGDLLPEIVSRFDEPMRIKATPNGCI